jgi:hypothetical protein
MLAWQRCGRPPAAVGDVTHLPLRDRAVDDVLAAFVLNHLDDPAAELARLTRPGGALLASGYSTASRSAARHAALPADRRAALAAPSCCAGAEKAVEQR